MYMKLIFTVLVAVWVGVGFPAPTMAQTDEEAVESDSADEELEAGEEAEESELDAVEASEAREAEEEPDAEPLFQNEETLAEERADEAERLEIDRVPLSENFSFLRLGIDGAALGGGMALVLLDGDILGKETPSMGAPRRGSIDYDISIALHGDLQEGSAYLGGASDILGYTLTLGPAAFYGVSAAWWAIQGEPLLGWQSANIDHSFWGYFETMAWTAFVTGALKTLIGRDRPYAAFERSAYGDVDDEGFQGAFPSSFAAFSFASAAYVARDLSAFLTRQGAGFWTSTALPFTVLYGTAALVSAGRIYQQQAYFSDALVGATIGALIGNLVWIDHFDSDGNPDGAAISDEESVFLSPGLIRNRNEVTWTLGVSGAF